MLIATLMCSLPAHAAKRCADLSLEASLNFDADTLLSTTLLLITRSDIRLLSRAAIADLMTLSGARTQKDLLEAETQARILEVLQIRLGKIKFQKALGESAVDLAKVVRKQGKDESNIKDAKDMLRGWGTLLLPENDRAFTDPIYLVNLLRLSGQTGSKYVERDYVGAWHMFVEAWQKNTNGTSQPELFATSGSDANSLVYDIARNTKGNEAGVLTLKGMYIATRGEASKHRYDPKFQIEPPFVTEFTPAELNNPQKLAQAKAALTAAEAKLAQKKAQYWSGTDRDYLF
jgi:hypothetical protein